MYIEVPFTRNGVLIGGNAFTDRRKAVAWVRAFLLAPRKHGAGFDAMKRVGFRTWRGPEGTQMRIDVWA